MVNNESCCNKTGIETVSKRVVQKTAEATVDLFRTKTADKVISAGETKSKGK